MLELLRAGGDNKRVGTVGDVVLGGDEHRE